MLPMLGSGRDTGVLRVQWLDRSAVALIYNTLKARIRLASAIHLLHLMKILIISGTAIQSVRDSE
jgi:hypothetical protein